MSRKKSPRHAAQPLILVTGPSGAGRSTAIRALEDIGYEAIDNVPFGLFERLFAGDPLPHPMALGLDVRNRDFSVSALMETLDAAKRLPGYDAEVLYIDCTADVLLRRYSETRRRHPLAADESPETGIARERDLLRPLLASADVLIDTTDMTPHALRTEIERLFDRSEDRRLALTIQSFSYKRGIPAGADMVFDCRFLDNPHWQPELRSKDGRDAAVAAHISSDSRFAAFFSRLSGMADFLLPAYLEEGRAHLSIAFGCTGGRHRSVFLAERLAESLEQQGWRVSIRHRELGRSATAPTAPDDARDTGRD